jgi:archaellum component FlaC
LVSVALFNGVYLSLRATKTTPFIGFLKRSEKKEKLDEGIVELKQVEEKSLIGLSKKKNEEVKSLMKRMMELENSIREIECESEKVFRGLISTRVSLLNALTH